MSGYKDLVDTWWQSRSESIDYHDLHRGLAARLTNTLKVHLEIPAESFSFYPLEGDASPGTEYGIAAATGFQDDGWYHVRFLIKFQKAPDILPIQPYLFRVSFRQADNRWNIRLFDNATPFVIDDSEDGYREFTERFYEELRTLLSRTVRDFIEASESETMIGFRLPLEEDEAIA